MDGNQLFKKVAIVKEISTNPAHNFENQEVNLLVKGDSSLEGKLNLDGEFTTTKNINVHGKVQENGSDLLPAGAIIMWHGASVPKGWALCDGKNNTPDLRGRFVIGATLPPPSTEIMKVGENENEKKAREDAIKSRLVDEAKIPKIVFAGADGGVVKTDFEKSISGSGLDMGKNEYIHHLSNDNLPPYYALYYIMKLPKF